MTGDRYYPREYFQRDVLNLIRNRLIDVYLAQTFYVTYDRLHYDDRYKGLRIVYRGAECPIKLIDVYPLNTGTELVIVARGHSQYKKVVVPLVAPMRNNLIETGTSELVFKFINYWIGVCYSAISGFGKPHTNTVMRKFFEMIVDCHQTALKA